MTVPQPYRIERYVNLPDMPFHPIIVSADQEAVSFKYAVDAPLNVFRWQTRVVAIEPEDVRYPATGDAPQTQPEPERIKVGDKVLLKGTTAPEFVVAAITGGPSNREDGIRWLRLVQVWADGKAVMGGRDGGPSIVEDIDINAVERIHSTTRAIDDIAVERRRQIESSDHDDQHDAGDLAAAGSAYALSAASLLNPHNGTAIDPQPEMWPFEAEYWKPQHKLENVRRDLVKAGALIAAEIDRIDRQGP